MSFVTTGIDDKSQPVELFFQDWGQGKPLVLIHGWPLSHEMWEHQLSILPRHGLRVIAYDRRGFGQSSKPFNGYDYDTLADDLKALLDHLELDDVTLAGFSMGGGEVARYMKRHGGARVGRVALISAVTPFLLKTEDNADGIEAKTFDDMVDAVIDDRPAFLSDFGKKFYGVSLLSSPVSLPVLDWTQGLAMRASPKATEDCIVAFSETDFRADLPAIHVPTLIIHGDADAIVPIKLSGERSAALISHADFKVYGGAPHGLFITHKDELSSDLLAFTQRQ